MNRLLKSFWVSAVVLCSFGCSTTASYRALSAEQKDHKALIQHQLERIFIQEQTLAQVQGEQSLLVAQLDQVRAELNAIKSNAKTGESKNVKRIKPQLKAEAKQKDVVILPAQLDSSGKVILGRVEWVWFDLLAQNVKAQLDTGIKTSQIFASDVQLFERDGKSWVRFTLGLASAEAKHTEVDGEHESAPVTLQAFETPIIRKIKSRQNVGYAFEKRPVVKLKVKVGELAGNAEFVVNQKEGSTYSFILGRSFLRDIAVVDVALKFTQAKLPSEPPAL